MLDGGADNDTLYGCAGNDTLWGQGGADYLYGDDGNDVFNTKNDGAVDRIFGGMGTDNAVNRDTTPITDIVDDEVEIL